MQIPIGAMQPYPTGQTMEDIKAAHPFPWRPMMIPNPMLGGRIFVLDANNREVAINHMVRLCELLTNQMPATAES